MKPIVPVVLSVVLSVVATVIAVTARRLIARHAIRTEPPAGTTAAEPIPVI